MSINMTKNQQLQAYELLVSFSDLMRIQQETGLDANDIMIPFEGSPIEGRKLIELTDNLTNRLEVQQ